MLTRYSLSRVFLFFWCLSSVLCGSHRAFASKREDLGSHQRGIFTQKLDHFNPGDSNTFQQRFLFENVSAKNGRSSPVIFYMCAEGNCLEDQVGLWARHIANKTGAFLVALEHRYYGKSSPYSQLTAENLKYLSVEQALADNAAFQQWLSESFGLKGKWLAIGGSYGGSLAAFYRLKYPHLISGAIASSAPLLSSNGSYLTDQFASRLAGPNCTLDFRSKILSPILQELGNGTEMKKLKALFQADSFADDLDFLATVSSASIFLIQEEGPTLFCNSLQSSEPMISFSKHLMSYLNEKWKLPFGHWSFSGVSEFEQINYSGALGLRQWNYQACSLFGSGRSNPNEKESFSIEATDALFAKYCDLNFGIKEPSKPEILRRNYYEPLLDSSQASQILFVNGSDDVGVLPYSIAAENGNLVNPKIVALTIPGAKHCEDLNFPNSRDSRELKAARDFEIEKALEWLK
jgi:pimeloyl-ACP methyl ester carboxylesterase